MAMLNFIWHEESAITQTNAGLWSIGPLGTIFSEILIKKQKLINSRHRCIKASFGAAFCLSIHAQFFLK